MKLEWELFHGDHVLGLPGGKIGVTETDSLYMPAGVVDAKLTS